MGKCQIEFKCPDKCKYFTVNPFNEGTIYDHICINNVKDKCTNPMAQKEALRDKLDELEGFCEWDELDGTFNTECDHICWIEDLDMVYCPYCGKKIEWLR